MVKKHILITILTVLLSALSGISFAQNKATIFGVIKDKSTGEPIPGATIIIGHDGTTSNEFGEYTLENISPNLTLVKVSMIGFQSEKKAVNLSKGKKLRLNFLLEKHDIELGEFVITGTRTRKSIDNSPVLTKIVSDEEIKEIGAVTAFEAIESAMPGVQFSPDAHGDNIQVQGLDNKYVLVLLDGERLANETRGNVNFNRINASDIKRIEIINGSSSVLYGSNAMGAIINIITKDVDKPLEGNISSRYSKFNTFNHSFRVGTNRKKFNLMFNGFRNSSDGYTLTADTTFTDLDTIAPIKVVAQGYTDYSGGVKAEYKINDMYRIKAHGNYFQHENILPENSLRHTHVKSDNITGGATVLATFSDRHSLDFNMNTDLYRGFKVYDNKNDSTVKEANYQYTTFLLSDVYAINPTLEMVTGAEFNMEHIYSLSLFGTDIPDADKKKQSSDMNAFVQLDYQLLKQLEIIGGARYTYHSSFGSHFTPKVSLMYKLNRFKFRGNASKGYKSPTLKELYYNFDHQGMFWIYGNPDLKPENANYFSLSGEYTKGSFNMSINAYQNSIINKIQSITTINSVTHKMELHYKNVAEARITGIESYMNFSLFSHLKVRLGYAYTHAENVSTGLELYGNSRHTGNASFTWKISEIKTPLSITLTGRAASPRLYQSIVENTNYDTGEVTTEIVKRKSKAYTLWNASYTQNFPIYKDITLDLQVGVRNIFNYSELVRSAVVNPGRTFYGGLTIHF